MHSLAVYPEFTFLMWVPAMWSFSLRSIMARKRAWKIAGLSHWTPMSLPVEMERGEADPERSCVRYFPSIYDIPTGLRAVHTEQAWVIAWRYLQPDDSIRHRQIGVNTWALEGKYSQRLLGLEGIGDPSLCALDDALSAWLASQPDGACSHRRILAGTKSHALDVFDHALPNKSVGPTPFTRLERTPG